MNLTEAVIGQDYVVKDIVTDDEELKSFLFSLGCYKLKPKPVLYHTASGTWNSGSGCSE